MATMTSNRGNDQLGPDHATDKPSEPRTSRIEEHGEGGRGDLHRAARSIHAKAHRAAGVAKRDCP